MEKELIDFLKQIKQTTKYGEIENKCDKFIECLEINSHQREVLSVSTHKDKEKKCTHESVFWSDYVKGFVCNKCGKWFD